MHADDPQALGRTVYKDYPIEDVLDYIDWNPFFQVGMLCLLQRNIALAAPAGAWAA